MGLFDFLSRSVINRAKNYASTTSFQAVNNLPPVYPDSRLSTFIHAYTSNASVYSILSLVARKASSIPWYCYDVIDEKAAKDYKRIHKHISERAFLRSVKIAKTNAYQEQDSSTKLSQLINQPNEYQGQDSFLFGCFLYYFLCGEVFIWLNKGKSEDELKNMDTTAISKLETLEMFILPPQYMEIIPDPDNVYGVSGYQLQVNGGWEKYQKGEIIHWKMFNPIWDGGVARTHLRGQAPLAAGLKILTQDDDAVDASVAMYQNGGVKAIVYNKTLNKLTPTQQTQLDDVIDAKINNPRRKAAVAALQGDWGLLQVGNNSVDMQLLEGQEQTQIKLCNVFGVPPELFIKNNTYENKNQARKDLLTSLIIPAGCAFRDELIRMVLPGFKGKKQTIDIDYADIPELQQDLKYLVDSLKEAWWLTPNQRLKIMNEEENKDPLMDKIYIPSSLQPIENTDVENEMNQLSEIGLNDYRRDREPGLAAVS